MDTNLKLHLCNDKNLMTRTTNDVIKVNLSLGFLIITGEIRGNGE